jgi:radical SAM protein with 4Fe4S-binding SPASM domain
MTVASTDLLERLVTRAQRDAIPLEVLVEVTHRCNLPCAHCYLPAGSKAKELTLDELARIFDELAAAGTIFLTLTGGEVMSRRDFVDILDLGAARGFALKVLTNATMIDDVVADRFRAAGVMDVSVSVYGATAEVHDGVTGMAGSFDKTMAGIDRLRARQIHVTIKTPMLTLNGRAAKDVLTWSQHQNMPCTFDMAMTPKNDGDLGPLALQLAHGAMMDLLSTAPFKDSLGGGDLDGPGPEPCNAGRAYCAIGPTGDVSPCVMMPVVLGSLRERSFRDIWTTAPFLERVRALTPDDLVTCRGCEVKGACTRCPGIAMRYGHDVVGCDPSGKAVARARKGARLRVLGATG